MTELLAEIYFGTPAWARVMTVAALVVGIVELASNLLARLVRGTGRRSEDYMRAARLAGYRPSCALILPTKGLPHNAEANFRSFLELDYPDYDLYFTVESEDDSGVPLIRLLIEGRGRAHLVIAGPTGCYAQKNHQLLAAVDAAADAEVLVFADNDIRVPGDWMEKLVAPLLDERVAVTSGFRWILPERAGWGEQAHVLMNVAIYSYLAVLAGLAGNYVWGGSWAVRRETFDSMGVAERWKTTFSDDMSLSNLLMEQKRLGLLVPDFTITTSDAIGTMRGAMLWFQRQITCLKAYRRVVWALAGMPVFMVAAAVYVLLPVSLAGSLLLGGSFWQWGGTAVVVFFGFEYLTSLTYGLLGRTRRHLLFTLRTPVLLAPMIAGYLRTFFSNEMKWSGRIYRFGRRGRVTDVVRM